MIENAGLARPQMESLNHRTQCLGRKHFHRHTIVLVKYTCVLNPKWKLWCPISCDAFAIENCAGHSRAMSPGRNKVPHLVWVLSWHKAVRRRSVNGWLK